MKPYTKDTHGRNHHFGSPHKDCTVPKRSKARRGTRSSKRQENNMVINIEIKEDLTND
jgi:hypothetical protein